VDLEVVVSQWSKHWQLTSDVLGLFPGSSRVIAPSFSFSLGFLWEFTTHENTWLVFQSPKICIYSEGKATY